MYFDSVCLPHLLEKSQWRFFSAAWIRDKLYIPHGGGPVREFHPIPWFVRGDYNTFSTDILTFCDFLWCKMQSHIFLSPNNKISKKRKFTNNKKRLWWGYAIILRDILYDYDEWAVWSLEYNTGSKKYTPYLLEKLGIELDKEKYEKYTGQRYE